MLLKNMSKHRGEKRQARNPEKSKPVSPIAELQRPLMLTMSYISSYISYTTNYYKD